uniref:diphthine--ammonia ligase-like n=1 Tax=Styela clava TaxID=7725 RepID=UPI0019399A9A|nr:diphthine--ammonia ligase-like [Styela clava]
MRVIALISGGKDSCFNMMHAHLEGHDIVGLANLYPSDTSKDELDSYMYQTVGHEAIELYSEAMEIPLFRRKISGTSKIIDLNYVPDDSDEVEDLYELLKEIQRTLHFDAVASGAILSDYQRIRVESVCSRLGVTSLSYLWRRNQEELLQEMIASGLKAVLIKTAALGLDPRKHLGKTLNEVSETLHKLNKEYGCHVCGEGGEFETFTLDCPLFKKRIVIDGSDIIIHSDDYFAPVGYLKLKKMHLEQKSESDIRHVDKWHLLSSKKWEEKYVSELNTDKPDSGINNDGEFLRISWEESATVDPQNEPGVTNHEKFLTVSNLVGTTSDEVTSDIVEIVTLQLLEKLVGILSKHGHKQDNICYVQVNVSEMSHYKHINKVYTQFFKQNPPARACIGCISNSNRTDKKTILQIYCISCKDHSSKKCMHVQGLSHWAPANIGPFSQCVLVDDLLFVSGTIALIPGNLQLITGGAETQASLALHHVENVMNAMSRTSLKSFMPCICYLTNVEDISHGIKAWTCGTDNSDKICEVIYLVVNELPKEASAEWQGIALSLTEECEIGCHSGHSKHSNIVVTWNYYMAAMENKEVYSFTSSISLASGHVTSLELKHCINYIQDSVRSWLSDCHLNEQHIVQASVFYTGENLLPESVLEYWNKADKCSQMPLITPVQVKKIYINNRFNCMTISCLAYKKIKQ